MYVSCSALYSYLFFFFQAEDGIRDIVVTGVQTCALPISSPTCAPREETADEGQVDSQGRRRAGGGRNRARRARRLVRLRLAAALEGGRARPADRRHEDAARRPEGERAVRLGRFD